MNRTRMPSCTTNGSSVATPVDAEVWRRSPSPRLGVAPDPAIVQLLYGIVDELGTGRSHDLGHEDVSRRTLRRGI